MPCIHLKCDCHRLLNSLHFKIIMFLPLLVRVFYKTIIFLIINGFKMRFFVDFARVV